MIVNQLKLVQKLKALEEMSKKDDGASVAVGYTGDHVLALHEMTPKNIGKPRAGKRNLRRRKAAARKLAKGLITQDQYAREGVLWGPSLYGNQWLLGPARQNARAVAETIRKGFNVGKTPLLTCLYTGGLLIQRESQRVVPRDTGETLKHSFVEKEQG